MKKLVYGTVMPADTGSPACRAAEAPELQRSRRAYRGCYWISLLLWLPGWRWSPVISQGNEIEQGNVEQLAVGMTRDQVRFLMGTPVLQTPARPNLWCYVQLQVSGNQVLMHKKVEVTFDESDRVVAIAIDNDWNWLQNDESATETSVSDAPSPASGVGEGPGESETLESFEEPQRPQDAPDLPDLVID